MKLAFIQRSASPLKRLILTASLVGSAMLPLASHAQVGVNVAIVVPPPPPRVEVVPAAPPGYVWTPGYWEWFHGHYIWRRGHFIAARPGYVWVPDRWEGRQNRYYFDRGHWAPNPAYRAHGPKRGPRGHDGRHHRDRY